MRVTMPLEGRSEVERQVLSRVALLVPLAERDDFLRVWSGELWHKRQLARQNGGLLAGMVRDALWLRRESWRKRFEGTAVACAVRLGAGCIPSAGLAIELTGGKEILAARVLSQMASFLTAATLVVLVNCVVSPRRPLAAAQAGRPMHRVRRGLFFGLKSGLLLALTYLLSLDLLTPLHLLFPATADLLQMLCFVIGALVGLRWAFQDQDERCQECLRALAAPTRVGRPSRNLLEWSGTRLACRYGHGLLRVPELETSWAPRGEWVVQ